MAQTSRFWESVSYSDDNFAEVLNRLLTDAVVGGVGNELVVAAGTGLQVTVNTGEAWVNGVWYQNTASVTLTCGAGDPSNPRIDRVVIRKSASGNTCELAIVAGTPAGSPTAPSLTQTTATWEISLAQVAIAAGASAVGTITSERKIESNGVPKGLIAYTASSSAPTGWAEYTAARGRCIVGVPSGGTLAGTVGTALTNQQNKTHSHTGPSHTHPQNTSGTQFATSAEFVVATSTSGQIMYTTTGGAGTGYVMQSGVQAGGTGSTGDASLGDFFAYIQLLGIQKS